MCGLSAVTCRRAAGVARAQRRGAANRTRRHQHQRIAHQFVDAFLVCCGRGRRKENRAKKDADADSSSNDNNNDDEHGVNFLVSEKSASLFFLTFGARDAVVGKRFGAGNFSMIVRTAVRIRRLQTNPSPNKRIDCSAFAMISGLNGTASANRKKRGEKKRKTTETR